jgi:4a-hydroxytetrahydrobiopterin dehydratase
MMNDLASRDCAPCRGGVPPMGRQEIENLIKELNGWEVVEHHHLRKIFEFENFRDALALVNRVAVIAEAQGHHPDISFGWGHAEITIWTHKIDGLTESDFILAAKIDKL